MNEDVNEERRLGCWMHKQMQVDLPVSTIPLKGTVMPQWMQLSVNLASLGETLLRKANMLQAILLASLDG